jgi:hypothetical protein
MMLCRIARVSVVVGVVLWSAVAQAQTTPPPTTPPPQQTTPPPTTPPDQTTDLGRIREGLNRPQVIRLEQDRLRFYLQIVGKRIDIHEYLRNSDLRNAPVPRAGVTHQDFLNLITPKYLYSSGGINAPDLLQWGLVNWLGQMAVKKVVTGIADHWREADVRRIREQIDRELAALKGGK